MKYSTCKQLRLDNPNNLHRDTTSAQVRELYSKILDKEMVVFC